MNDDISPFSEEISDEAAFALSEALYWLAMTCEERYIGQILRHRDTMEKPTSIDPERPWIR